MTHEGRSDAHKPDNVEKERADLPAGVPPAAKPVPGASLEDHEDRNASSSERDQADDKVG